MKDRKTVIGCVKFILNSPVREVYLTCLQCRIMFSLVKRVRYYQCPTKRSNELMSCFFLDNFPRLKLNFFFNLRFFYSLRLVSHRKSKCFIILYSNPPAEKGIFAFRENSKLFYQLRET